MKNRIVNILSDKKPSIYLYGSIVLEDFKVGWSDIDILCLTETKISDTQAKKLLNLRQDLLSEYGCNLHLREQKISYYNHVQVHYKNIDIDA